jgi:hypothetical protein
MTRSKDWCGEFTATKKPLQPCFFGVVFGPASLGMLDGASQLLLGLFSSTGTQKPLFPFRNRFTECCRPFMAHPAIAGMPGAKFRASVLFTRLLGR